MPDADLPAEVPAHPVDRNEARGVLDNGLLERRLAEILLAHRHDPRQDVEEGRHRRLAERLLAERANLAEELANSGMSEIEIDAEFRRRSAALARLETIWTPDDPASARRHDEDAPKLPGPRDTPAGLPANTLDWVPVLDLPGYQGAGPLGEAIRTLGRRIFAAFPCFQRLSRQAAEADLDALGQVQSLSTLLPGQADAVRARFDMLQTSCLPVAAARVPGLSAMPGYTPDMGLALSEDTSFLLLRERRSTGAPLDADTIHAWHGGLAFYRNNPDAIAALRAFLKPEATPGLLLEPSQAAPRLR